MRKLLFGLALCLSTLSYAQQFLSYGTSLTKQTTPVRTVKNTSDGLIVTYRFNGANITKDPLYPNAYKWSISGCVENQVPAQPAYLSKVDKIRVPQGMDAVISVESTTGKSYNYELSPARPNLISGSSVGYSRKNVLPIAKYSGKFPAEVAKATGISYYRGNGILNVVLHPIQYDMETKSIYAYEEITYKVTFVKNTAEARSRRRTNAAESSEVKNDADSYLGTCTISNTDMMPANNSVENNKGYLFITSRRFEDQTRQLAAWKRYMGFKTYVEVEDTWTPEKVMAVVQSHYAKHDISYFLIFGCNTDVPGANPRTVYTLADEDFMSTNDYTYACMDGADDYVADIHRSRIAARNVINAQTYVDKIINYEKNPVRDPKFWKKAIHCSYFEDYCNLDGEMISDGQADSFTYYSNEYIKNCVEPMGFTVTRILAAEDSVNPKYDYFGDELPIELQRDNHSWKQGSSDIIAAVNDGAMYMTYMGHGRASTWVKPSCSRKTVDKFTNGDQLPFVFSYACSTGQYSSVSCLANIMMIKQNGGAAGVWAAFEESFGGPDDAMAQYMFRQLSNNYDNGIGATVGELLDQSLDFTADAYAEQLPEHAAVGTYTKDTYHWFGDASMWFNTEMPTDFENVNVTFEGDQVTVTIADSTDATITLVDSESDDVQSFIGTSATFTLKNPNTTSADICVSGYNKVPYIQHVMRGEIADVNYNSIEGNLNIKYSVAGTDNATVKVLLQGEVVAEEELDLTSDSLSMDILLKPETYTIELSAEGVVLDTTEVAGTSYIMLANNDWANRLTVDYEVNASVKKAEIKMIKNDLMVFGPKHSIACANRTLDLTSGNSGTVNINTSLMLAGDYTLYLVEDGEYTYYSTVTCSPAGPTSELTVDNIDADSISGRFRFVYGSKPKFGYIRLYKESLIRNVFQHYVLMDKSKASYSYEISLNADENQIDGTYFIGSDEIEDGKYYMALYSEDKALPLTFIKVEINNHSDENGESHIIAASRSNGTLTVEYKLGSPAQSAYIVATNTANVSDTATEAIPEGTTDGTVQLSVSSDNSSAIYVIQLIIDNNVVESKKIEVE